jgi:hypothetical protein
MNDIPDCRLRASNARNLFPASSVTLVIISFDECSCLIVLPASV